MTYRKHADENYDVDPIVPSGRFIDLAVLVFAYQTHIRHLEAVGGHPGPLASKGGAMIKRYSDEIINGFDRVIAPLAERPDAASIRTLIVRASKATSPTPVAISYWAEAIQAVMPWVKTRPAIFSSLFTGKVARAARELAAAAEEENHATILNHLAAIAPVSGVTAPRKWIELLASNAGAPISTTESVLTDAETGQNLGQDLQLINTKIDASTPNTPDAADLQTQRMGLVSKIEDVAKKSKAPSAVLSAAATSSTNQRRSTIAERFRLTPEQKEVSETMGKVVVAAGAGSGKCIKGDSLVRTGKGLISIGEFGQGLDVGKAASCNEQLFGIDGVEASSNIYRDGLCKTIKVTTSRGYTIEGTASHPILVLRDAKPEWVKLGVVAEEDFICIDRRPGLFPAEPFRVVHPKRTRMHFNTQIPEELTPQVASLLGYIVSEGCVRVGVHCNTNIATKDPDQLDLYRDSFRGIITNFRETPDKRNGVININFTRLADIHALMDFGLTSAKAHEKEIPLGILQSPRNVVVAFLRALFDGDGEASSNTVGYASASYVLAHQVQVLLLSFGIVSKLKFKPNRCKGCWNVFITGDNLRTFVREIGFNLVRKQHLAEASLDKASNTNIDTIPGLAGLCRTIHDECKAKGDAHWNDPKHGRHRCYWEGDRNPPVDGLREFLDVFKVNSPAWEKLNQLTKEPWFYDPVDTIEEGEAEVYDFVVPGTHSFSADGFICHNTSTLVATIANLVENKGYAPDQIMTCSFTRAASAELGLRLERDGKVSGVVSGTTHRIARDIITRHRPNWIGAMRNQRGADRCFKMAIKQVGMSVEGFNQQMESQKKVLQRIESIPGWRNKEILRSFHDQASRGRPLSPKQIDVITKFESGDGWRRWAEQIHAPVPPLSKPTSDDWLRLVNAPTPSLKNAAFDDDDVGNEEVRKPSLNEGQRSKYDTAPVGMWFNIGQKIKNDLGETIGERAALLAVDNFKNSGITVDQAKAEFGIKPIVALYGAYEWLKLNDPVHGPAMDYTDQLAVALDILQTDPQALAAEQSRYKVILVDEAQDLNQIQFALFNLMGAKADLLSFIGDDKQCVESNTPILLADGTTKTAKDVVIGDEVLSYRNGNMTGQSVKRAWPTEWTWGYKITTTSGATLTMSPNHKLWATEHQLIDDPKHHSLTMLAHDSSGSQVVMEWVGNQFDHISESNRVIVGPDGRRRLQRHFASYRDALAFANHISDLTGVEALHWLSTPDGALREVTASALSVGVKVPVTKDGNLVLEDIVTIEKADGSFIDLDVNDASNFFGGGILSHNSIYAFRGAKPSNYIDLSKSGQYQTKLMTTNFRSGSEIVQAANRLIARNEDRQIPMVCKSHEARGTGAIASWTTATHEDAANAAAQQIKDGIDAGESASDFGILVRNNAESDAYTLALIVRGVPYRCLKANQGGYFAKPVVRALTAWTRLAIGGSTVDMNEAVITAHQVPGFFLDKMFAANLGRMAKSGNYYDYIARGGDVYTSDQAWRNRNVAAYVDAIRQIKVLGRGDSVALIHAILNLKGPKGTFVDALMNLVDEDDVVEEEGGEGGEEAIRQAALAPVHPLMIMAKNFSDPENMLAFITKMKAANEKVEKKSPDAKDDWKEPAVLVGTVHGWKGLETKHVFVSMAGGVFPNFRSDKLAEKQESTGQVVTAYDEERRLAYVAITRGRDTTTIMAPMKTYLGKPTKGNSIFISEACVPARSVSGDTEYAEDDDDVMHPDRMASSETAGTFVNGLVTSMEETSPSAGIISDMIL